MLDQTVWAELESWQLRHYHSFLQKHPPAVPSRTMAVPCRHAHTMNVSILSPPTLLAGTAWTYLAHDVELIARVTLFEHHAASLEVHLQIGNM